MHVLALQIDLRFSSPHSLKEKRAILKPIIEGSRRRYNVAVAEVDHQNLWQRAGVGFAVVAPTVSHAETVMDEVERFIWSFPEAEVLGSDRRWME